MADENDIPGWVHSEIVYLGKLNNRSNVIYLIILAFILSLLFSLPFLRFDLSVKAGGIIRPVEERIDIKSMVSGSLKTITVKEGQFVNKGDLLFSLDDSLLTAELAYLSSELEKKLQFSKDFYLLLNNDIASIKSSYARQQYDVYHSKVKEMKLSISQLKTDLTIERQLLKENVTAKRKVAEKEYLYEVALAGLKSYSDQQFGLWENELKKLQDEIAVTRSEITRLEHNKKYYEVYAPISGTVEAVSARFEGGTIEPGQIFCILSPQTIILGECYIPNKKIAYLYAGQECLFQIDAFNHNRFGSIKGKIISIDQDYIMINNVPSYKVRCSFETLKLSLPGGYEGSLKKGMTFNVRFKIINRSAWELLYDKIDDWINPNAGNVL